MANRILITESRFESKGVPSSDPRQGKAVLTNHMVWVGNDADGWIMVPGVTDVNFDLRQGELRKATITVLYPVVDFKEHPRESQNT